MTADVRYDTVLRCDFRPADVGSVKPCKATFRMETRWEYARKMAALQGWVYDVMRGDFCPDHARKGKPQ
jgi:hypothetical protein